MPKNTENKDGFDSQNHLTQVRQQFVKLIERNFPDGSEAIISALELSVEIHAEQKKRPDGKEYATHPIEVAEILISKFGITNPELIMAALLHDTAEDQPDKLAEKYQKLKQGNNITGNSPREQALSYIAETFSQKTAMLVSKLSNPEKIDSKTIPLEEKFKAYHEHVQEAIQDPEVAAIKFADFSTNAFRLDLLPEQMKSKLLLKYMPLVPIFIERLRDQANPVLLKDKESYIHALENLFSKNKQ